MAIQAGAIRENPASGPDGVGVRTDGVAYTIEARAEVQAVGQPVPYDLFQITAPVNRQNRQPGDPCHTLARDNAAHAAVVNMQGSKSNACVSTDGTSFTLNAMHGHDVHAVAVGFNWQNGGGYGNANEGLGITVEGTGPLQRCNTPAVAFSDTSATLKGGSGERGYPDPSDGNGHSMVGTAMTVRRLTARECERLQGFPDDYTLIPWRKKQAEDCPDGPRYRSLGNSMAVNCMSWIGERIAAVDAERNKT
jgi:DNA (cytosine-5)-methyltransferase 1